MSELAPRAAAGKVEPEATDLDGASTALPLSWSGKDSMGLSRLAQQLLFAFAQMFDIEVTGGFQPVLLGFHRQRPDQPQSSSLCALGKIRTTRVRRLISWLSRSSMLVLFMCL